MGTCTWPTGSTAVAWWDWDSRAPDLPNGTIIDSSGVHLPEPEQET